MTSGNVSKSPRREIYRHLSSNPEGRIAKTEIRGGLIISTVWTNADGNNRDGCRFETVVFSSLPELAILDHEKYDDLYSAKKGHLEMFIKWFWGGMDEAPTGLRIVEG